MDVNPIEVCKPFLEQNRGGWANVAVSIHKFTPAYGLLMAMGW